MVYHQGEREETGQIKTALSNCPLHHGQLELDDGIPLLGVRTPTGVGIYQLSSVSVAL